MKKKTIRSILWLFIFIIIEVYNLKAEYDYMSYKSNFTYEDYKEALRMALKFFGAQRCGDTYNWMLHENPITQDRPYCHTQDGQGQWYIDDVQDNTYQGHDLTGGWHDCGDHIKVAVTMGMAALTLLVAYDIWPDAFEDNYSQEYGPPDGIPDVLNEVKVATDYFMKSFPDENTFVYYVGNGDYDHKYWVTSSYQSTLPVEDGGDPRPVYATRTKGGPQAADYATALALMYKHYKKYDPDYAQQCLTYAKLAYNYAKNHTDNATIPTYYPVANTDWWDELALAAMILYNVTGDATYKDEAFSYYQNKWESNYPYCWDTVADATYYYMILEDPNANNENWGYIRDFLAKNVFLLGWESGQDHPEGFPFFASRWGTNKLAAGSAFAAGLLYTLWKRGVIFEDQTKVTLENSQASGTYPLEGAKFYARRIADYIMGVNEFGHTFIHGFKGDSYFKVHHRNAMGTNDNPPDDLKNSYEYVFPNSGALIGGPQDYNDFVNDVNQYIYTESGDDYNAPLVALLAFLVHTVGEEEGIKDSKVEKDFSLKTYPNPFNPVVNIEFNLPSPTKVSLKVYDIGGNLVKSLIENKGMKEGSYRYKLNGSKLSSGVYFIKLEGNNFNLVKKVVLMK